MRVLLDTHVLIWAIGAPHRLGSDAHALIADRDTELLVSAASAWEVATKHRLGKLPGVEALIDDWASTVSRLGAAELPVSAAHALYAGGLSWEHRDPFDRMLASQAILEGVPLVTSDRAFGALPGLRTRW